MKKLFNTIKKATKVAVNFLNEVINTILIGFIVSGAVLDILAFGITMIFIAAAVVKWSINILW